MAISRERLAARRKARFAKFGISNAKYDNEVKAAARNWVWNQLAQRLPGKPERKTCRIFTLIGETTKELKASYKYGFSPFNVIGVDLQKKRVEAWRKAGGIGVCLPLDLAVIASKIKPHAVICDYCGGFTKTNFNTLWLSFMNIQAPGALVVNMLRGRDPDIHKVRTRELELIMSFLRLDKRHRGHLIYANMLCDTWGSALQNCHPAIEGAQFKDFVQALNARLEPAFYSYKSMDGGHQIFDTMVLGYPKIMEEMGDGPQVIDEVANEALQARLDLAKKPAVTRKMAALEAIRTMKIQKNGGKLMKFMEV